MARSAKAPGVARPRQGGRSGRAPSTPVKVRTKRMPDGTVVHVRMYRSKKPRKARSQ